jgi:hypothetical protein
VGKYLELVARAKAKTPYDRNDFNDIRDKSETYERPRGGLAYDRSNGHPNTAALSASSVVTSVVANPLKKDLNRICRFGRTLSQSLSVAAPMESRQSDGASPLMMAADSSLPGASRPKPLAGPRGTCLGCTMSPPTPDRDISASVATIALA